MKGIKTMVFGIGLLIAGLYGMVCWPLLAFGIAGLMNLIYGYVLASKEE